jgi:hypothetical protein
MPKRKNTPTGPTSAKPLVAPEMAKRDARPSSTRAPHSSPPPAPTSPEPTTGTEPSRAPSWKGAMLLGLGMAAGAALASLLGPTDRAPAVPTAASTSSAPTPPAQARASEQAAAASGGPSSRLTGSTIQGPWGLLRIQTIALEPPLESLEELSNDCSGFSAPWVFPGYNQARLAELARSLNDASATATLRAPAVCNARACSISVPAELRAKLTPKAREQLYGKLAEFENPDYSAALQLPEAEVDAWLARAVSQPDVRAYARSLFYPRDGRLAFADPELVCERLPDGGERRAFLRAMFAAKAQLVSLRIEPGESMDEVLRYWSKGPRRRKNIEPILRALATSTDGGSIDVAHLLPWSARKLLYTFPSDPPVDPTRRKSCHWTSLNFGRVEPLDDYLDDAVAEQAFERDYLEVAAASRQYADLVLFRTREGKLIHSAVYVAGDLVFTKNGRSPRRPWVLERLDDVRALYPKAPLLSYARKRAESEYSN